MPKGYNSNKLHTRMKAIPPNYKTEITTQYCALFGGVKRACSEM